MRRVRDIRFSAVLPGSGGHVGVLYRRGGGWLIDIENRTGECLKTSNLSGGEVGNAAAFETMRWLSFRLCQERAA